jgi:DNA-binding SARP family transcriptional activator
MPTSVHLIGRPALYRDGLRVASPRGRKAWALLGYLISSSRAVSRRHLAELLFSEADDPLGALRWTLAELRRSLGVADAFRGDPIDPRLPGIRIDTAEIEAGNVSVLLEASGMFLEGIEVEGCAAFESWLVVERFRRSAEQEARLHNAADAAFAERDFQRCVDLAARAVTLNMYEEGHHELLVRGLSALGDRAGAARQVAVCDEVFRRELGHPPSSAVRAAAERVASPVAPRHRPREVEGLLERGQAALSAGATLVGLDALVQSVAVAESVADSSLHARSLLALGDALVHAVRGRDGEAATVLHQALHLAEEIGDATIAMTACRELGFVEVQAGRRRTATEWLQRAEMLCVDDGDRAATLSFQAMNLADSGHHLQAIDVFDRSVELAARAGDVRQQAWSRGVQSRSLTLVGDLSRAMAAADESIELCRTQRWMAFLPWPQAFRAELHLEQGRADLALDEIQPAWSLACQLGDPCWEGVTARVLSALSAHEADSVTATTWLEEALRRCEAAVDTYQWVRAYIIDSQVELALSIGALDVARRKCDDLAVLAGRTEMHEFTVLTHIHRASLGDRDAPAAARLLIDELESPALAQRVHDLKDM